MIKVSKTNKRFFEVDGKITYLFNSGMNGVPGDAKLSEMIRKGVNTFYIQVPFLKGSKLCPWLGRKGIEKNFGGWNEAAFKKLQDESRRLSKRDCFLLIVIDGSPLRRHKWEDHLWNKKNGGPVPSDKNGVPAFYKYGVSKQKDFLKKLLVEELPESKYQNILVALNWEVFNGWSSAKDWTVDLINYCHKLTKYRPFGIGTFYYDHLAYLNSKIGRPAFGIAEGADIFWLLNKSKGPKKWPWVECGFHCHPDAFWGQKPAKICARFEKGMEMENMKGVVKNICHMAKIGVNPSFPFEHWQARTGHITKDCGRDLNYDYAKFSDMLGEFAEKFNAFMERRVKVGSIPSFLTSRKIRRFRNKCMQRLQ